MGPVHQYVAEYSTVDPDRLAVIGSDGTLTYAELYGRACATAHQLRAAGVRAGDVVGLATPPSLDGIVGLYGILLAGSAYVYLDPAHPERRLEHMLDECDATVVVVDDPGRRHPEGSVMVPVAEDATARPASGASDDGLRKDAGGHDPDRGLCYICFTSGSTGEPKGVLVEHRGVTNMARGLASVFEIGASSRVLQFASWNFDAAAAEIFMSAAAGATLCLAPEEARHAGPELERYLRQQRVTVATLTPSVLSAVSCENLTHLATVAAVGERCQEEHVARWSRGRRFFNGYGPTEATVAATVGELRPGEGIHIGRPIPGVEIRLIDPETGVPVAHGDSGELQIGGAGVARGYLNRPQLTAERFLVDADDPRKRWYRSGDLARRGSDGVYLYEGRLDDQVKVNGMRIELGEIEATLYRHELVKQAAVVPSDNDQRARLDAYVAPVDDSLSVRSLKRHLREWLPGHMVPHRIVLMEELPLNAWGKLDRAALRRPDDHPGDVEHGHDVGHGHDIVSRVAAVLREILGSPSLHAEDDMFEHGGHSLLAAQVSVELKTALDVDVSVLEVFDHPSAGQLAALVEAKKRLRAGR